MRRSHSGYRARREWPRRRAAEKLRCGISIRPLTAWGHERRCRDVRGTSALPPVPTRIADIPDSQLGAKSRREQSQQGSPYSITSSASESRLSEILMPSAFAVLRLDHPGWFLIYPSL